MKRIITVLILVVTFATLTACGSNAQKNQSSSSSERNTETDAAEGTENTAETDTTTTDATGTNSNMLVVYFSWSGNTKEVAELIQSQTGADIFEITPKTPYTDDYNAVVDQAQEEQSDNARPVIAGTIENIESYDTILLGYPNWWGDMPMILYSFLDDYDLSGKTIAPFVTSSSSGLSNTVHSIQTEEPKATVTEGLSVREDDLDSAQSAVSEWLSELGLVN